MATRFIKDSIWTSPNLNQLSDMAERHFYRLLPLPDDHGCCEVTAAVVKGRCYPLKPKVTIDLIIKWTAELEAQDIIRTWTNKGRVFAYFPTWSGHQRIRSLNKRKTPEPPASVVTCRQLSQVAALSSLPSLLSSLPQETTLSGSPPDDAGLVATKPKANNQAHYKQEAISLLSFLNEKTGRHYEPVEANVALIVARLREGATPDQCRQVIAKKAREWLPDEKMQGYLRPATLFNRTKFAQYHGEIGRPLEVEG